MLKVSHPTKKIKGEIDLTTSKSESNRLLIIQALCSEPFDVINLATAEDTVLLKNIVSNFKNERSFNAGDGGSVLRFGAAFLATQQGKWILTGSDRLKQRPIAPLVEALRSLGATINYTEKEGYAPLEITGKKLKGGEIIIPGNISSQFVSALLLISTQLQNGLVIHFSTEVVSRPYINMTLRIMEEFRVYGQWQGNSISVSKQEYHKKSEGNYAYTVEADWSSASYWYAIASMANEADIKLKGLKQYSKQGDSLLSDLYTFFGIKTTFEEDGIRLSKIPIAEDHWGYDFSDCPDIAQTVAVTACGLEIPMLLNGLKTLRIKETDRIAALKNEIEKTGTTLDIFGDTIELKPNRLNQRAVTFKTYNDHRMAMAFATLAMKMDHVTIENPEVVKKSYPTFWNDLKKLGFTIESI